MSLLLTLSMVACNQGSDETKEMNNSGSQSEEIPEVLTADIVVVGSGGAGLSAAVEAINAGKSVIVLEKMPIIGGNTLRATGAFNAAETKYQEEQGIEDSKETFFNDTMEGGKNMNDPDLLKVLVEHANESLEWINDMGAGLTDVTLSGGATNPRAHRPEDGSPVGPAIINTLTNNLEERGVEILLETTATQLLEEDGKVVGVEAEDKNGNTFKINAKAVILATGGFGANSEMVEEYRQDLKGYNTTNHPGATGDGIKMALEVGADLMHIDQIQTHPTTDPETGFMFTEAVRGDGAILLNKEGERFINELETRDVVSQAILEQTDGIAYLIFNQEMVENNKSLAGYIDAGYATEGEDIAKLAEAIGINAETAVATVNTYVTYVKNGNDEDFGRANLSQTLETGPYYAIPVTPSIHHTMGGLKIDTQTHVLNADGEPIPGLYAAGEVTGGIHGGNRIGGNAVADIVTFGRIAGQTAAAEIE